MVRRGSRMTGPLSSNISSSSGSNEIQWKPTRTQSASADTSLAKSANSIDSANSSPTSGDNTSPSMAPRKVVPKSIRSSSSWRIRRSGGGQSMMADSKFTITSEDFPELPGARCGNTTSSQSTPSKYVKKDKENGKLPSVRSVFSNKRVPKQMLQSDFSTTDDSGVSSGSRVNTPTENSETVPIRSSNSSARKNDYESKRKSAPSAFLAADSKRKNSSPAKERAPRGNAKHGRFSHHQSSSAVSSPRKKTIHANAANTLPSFMKLSKVGQKVPERRGGPKSNHQSPHYGGTHGYEEKEIMSKKSSEFFAKSERNVDLVPKKENNEPIVEKDLVSESKSKKTNEIPSFQSSLPPAHCIFHPSDVPKILLGPDGEMSNIPPTMLTDQFGMAAMLPILDIVKNRSVPTDDASLTEQQLDEKFQKENIEMTTIGFDLNELGVPMKTQEHSQKAVWETFAGPFGNQPLLPTNMSLPYNQVPTVYYTARTLQSNFDMLSNIPEKFGLHELFYIFYNLPKEIWQLNSARELQYRGWRYNIKERLWVLKKLLKQNEVEDFGAAVTAPQNLFTQPGPNQENKMEGNFEIYDVEKARICSAMLTLYRSDFEVPAWEQKTPDAYQRMVAAYIPKEMLWGPRDDRKNHGFMQGISGMIPNFHGVSRNKLANLTIPKPRNSSERRLLSFADSPDVSLNFENPFGNLPPATTADDICRQQMYTMILQKMQMHQQQQYHQQQQQHLSASNQSKIPASSSFSSSNFFQR